MIEIRMLNKEQLLRFINDPEFHSMKILPISRHRALSHIQNPRLNDDDILLLMAFKDKELVGYSGVLPDKVYLTGQPEKCGWLSCLWIDPKERGAGIARMLLEKAFEQWENRILVTEFTESAKRLYDKMNVFNDLQINKGIRLYLRSDLQTLLPPKKEFFGKIVPLLKVLDVITNLFFDIRFLFWRKKITASNYEFVKYIDQEIEHFIADKQQNQLFKRRAAELNWIIKNPWVLSAPKQDKESQKYHFSSTDKSFDFYALKVRNKDNRLVAFMLFSKRNNRLKLPYCYYEPDHFKTVVEVIQSHLIQWSISTFTTFHRELVQHLKEHKTPALLKREIKRHYLISKFFNVPEKVSFEIQDGDADCIFT